MHRIDVAGIPVAQVARRLNPLSMWMPRQIDAGLIDTATSLPRAVAVVGSATPHTKGSWVELVSATTAEVHGLMLSTSSAINSSGVDTSTLLDIGIGAAAAEVAIVPDLAIGFITNSTNNAVLPSVVVSIPTGSRVAMRLQSSVASKSVTIRAQPFVFRDGFVPAPYCKTYGTNAAASKGVAVTTGATNTKSSWVEITSATTERLAGFTLGLQLNGLASTSNGAMIVDIGLGAAGAEQVIVPDIAATVASSEAIIPLTPRLLYGAEIPRGSRLAARYATTTTTNQIDVSLVGFPWRA